MSPASRKPAPYHKGNLRQKLLREAARMIARHGIEQLSMRRLGARLGISRTAAYHHFADKQNLLDAVGRDGFRRLTVRLQEASATATAPLERLRAALLAYVGFAQEETEFFRLMFSRALTRPVSAASGSELEPFAFSSPEALAAFGALVDAVKQCQAAHAIRPGDPLGVANLLWGFVHGTACLLIDEHLKTPQPRDVHVGQSLDVIFAGLRPE